MKSRSDFGWQRIRRIAAAVILAAAFCQAAFAQQRGATTGSPNPPAHPEPVLMMNLWPGSPPGDKTQLGPEVWNGATLTQVATPTLALYQPPADKKTGACVIVAPGGGFYQLSMEREGWSVATWLNSIGVTAVVLKYRIPQRDGMPRYMAAFQDGQRAMSVVRSKAAEWGIDPHRVGMLGFSAGGQTTADVMTNFDKRVYEAVDEADKFETRPDFAILIYPGGIANKDKGELTDDVRVTHETPPSFIAIANDDRNGPENAVYLYQALKKAGVSAELHVYGEGGHGFGIRPGSAPHASWPARVADWMRNRGLLEKAEAPDGR